MKRKTKLPEIDFPRLSRLSRESFNGRNDRPVTLSKKTPNKISAGAAKINLYEHLAKARDKAFLLLTTHKNDPNTLAYYQTVLKHIEAAQDILSLKLLTPGELKELSAKK